MNRSSTSTKVTTCGFCHRGIEAEATCGQLYMDPEVCAHKKCMQYSALLVQYRTKGFGGFKKNKVVSEMKRGRGLRCTICKAKSSKKNPKQGGATCGCAIGSCRRTFHYYCAHQDDAVICCRIEVRNKFTDRASVLYRVFCNAAHQKMFEKSNAKELEISYNSESSVTEYSSGEDSDDYDSPKATKKSKAETNVANNKKEGNGVHEQKQKHASSLLPEVPSNKRPRSNQCEKTTNANTETKAVWTPNVSVATESGDDESAPESEQIADGSVIKPEPFSPPKMKTAPAQEKPESDVVLCIMEEGQHLQKYGSRIRQMISKQFSIRESCIHFWSSQGPHPVSPQHMLLFMRDVAKAVFQSNIDALQRLIIKPIQADLAAYSDHLRYTEDYMDTDLLAQTQARIRDVIGDYFLQTSQKTGEDAGGAFILADLNSIFIALPLGDQLDPERFIRSRLPGRELVYPVSLEADLLRAKKGAVSEKNQRENLDKEMTALSLWLQREVDESLKIRVRPKELILRQSTTMSNTCQLCNYFQRRTMNDAQGPTSVVMFIVPVRGEIMAYGEYCRVAIGAFVAEELTAVNPVYCVLDIDELEGFSCVENVLPTLPDNITSSAFSGLDTTVHPASCVVLKFFINL